MSHSLPLSDVFKEIATEHMEIIQKVFETWFPEGDSEPSSDLKSSIGQASDEDYWQEFQRRYRAIYLDRNSYVASN